MLPIMKVLGLMLLLEERLLLLFRPTGHGQFLCARGEIH
jgi:hypothetical protein